MVNKALILAVALLAVASAQAFQPSHEPVVVREEAHNLATRTYTFNCSLPAGAGPLRTWTIHTNEPGAPSNPDLSLETINDSVTVALPKNAYYHVSCGALNASQWVMSDFHVDLRVKPVQGLNVEFLNSNGSSFTARCTAGSVFTPQWFLFLPSEGRNVDLSSLNGAEVINYSTSQPGLWDVGCGGFINGSWEQVSIPIELFSAGPGYVANPYGCLPWESAGCEADDPALNLTAGVFNQPVNSTNQSVNQSVNNSQNNASNTTCYSSVESLPVSCGGVVVSDSFNGCRLVVCDSANGSTTALACDKPDGLNKYFEVYKQSFGPGPEVCFAGFCVGEAGFAKSNDYPVCVNQGGVNETPPSVNETINQSVNCYQGLTVEAEGFNPSVTLTVYEDNNAWMASLQLSSFSLDASRLGEDLVSTGYAEIYLDGSLVGRAYSPQYYLGELSPGHHLAEARLVTANHSALLVNGSPVTSNASFQVGCNATSLKAPFWIEPSQGLTGVTPDSFHLNVLPPVDDSAIQGVEWEIWRGAEKVWSLSSAGAEKYHVHSPDGTFQGSLAGKTSFEYLTTYKARVRYTGASISPWAEWRYFTTRQQPPQGSAAKRWNAAPGFKVELFATGLDVPVHLAAAPKLYNHLPLNKQPFLYVTELYGKVKVIYTDGSSSVYADNLLNFEPFGSITGGGQMGVIGLYVEPLTGDLFVSTVYVENGSVKNKVLRFQTNADGDSYDSVSTVIQGLPSAPSHQAQQITMHDGKLYLNLGEGANPNNAQDDSVLAGKIVRMNPDGSQVEVYAKGFRNPFGADWRPGTNQLFVTDNSPDVEDRLILVEQGANYGWCCDISQRLDVLNVSPVDVEFNPGGSGFPAELDGKLYVAVAGPIYQAGPVAGKHVLEYSLNPDGTVAAKRVLVEYVGTGYGTPIGLEFASDGLYFTDIYGEPGFTGLGKTEGNVYRVVQGNNSECSYCAPKEFRAGIQVIPWYPKDSGSGIQYIFECQGIDGSGNYTYDFDYGNGQSSTGRALARSDLVAYPYGDANYTVTCWVRDGSLSRNASMVVNPSNFIPE